MSFLSSKRYAYDDVVMLSSSICSACRIKSNLSFQNSNLRHMINSGPLLVTKDPEFHFQNFLSSLDCFHWLTKFAGEPCHVIAIRACNHIFYFFSLKFFFTFSVLVDVIATRKPYSLVIYLLLSMNSGDQRKRRYGNELKRGREENEVVWQYEQSRVRHIFDHRCDVLVILPCIGRTNFSETERTTKIDPFVRIWSKW